MSDGFLDHLQWRTAEKSFDTARSLEEEKLDKILEAIQMAPTSFGLQPFQVHVVKSPELKAKLAAAGYNQPQFTSANVILVFTSRTDLETRTDEYFAQMKSGGGTPSEEEMQKFKAFEDMLRGFIAYLPEAGRKAWADRQAYIALGFALAAAAELEVASCPMEGFSPSDFDQILGLPENQKSVVSLSLGYSTGAPARPKVRMSKEKMFSVHQ